MGFVFNFLLHNIEKLIETVAVPLVASVSKTTSSRRADMIT